MPFYCYILECSDGSFYTGWTTDLERRIHQHNGGYGSRYTRCRLPVRMIYSEEQPDRNSAMQRELQIKRMGREKKKKLIHSNLSPG